MYNYLDLKIDSQGRTGSASLFNLTAAFVMLLLLGGSGRFGDFVGRFVCFCGGNSGGGRSLKSLRLMSGQV